MLMTDYRVDVRVKNNNLLRKIEEAGYNNVSEFCRRNGKTSWQTKIGELVNLKISPLNAKGQFISIIGQICDILLCSPEDLFSDTQLTTALESNRRTIEVNEAEMQFMLKNGKESLALDHQVHMDRLEGSIDELLSTLTPRQASVISMRFGLGEYPHAHTLEETATLNNVTRERIRQIEAKALRKMRLPHRADIVRDYLSES